MGVELPLYVVVTILECCVTFSGVKLSIRSFVLFSTHNLKISTPIWLIADVWIVFIDSVHYII